MNKRIKVNNPKWQKRLDAITGWKEVLLCAVCAIAAVLALLVAYWVGRNL